MSAQTNTVPKTLTDEDLDGVSGGAVGINPALLLASGGQGIYTIPSGETHAAVATGVNPLYVDHTAVAGPSAPVYTPTHDVVPVPQTTAPTHDVTPVPQATAPIHAVTPAPQTPAPTHDTSVVIVNPSASLGQSLNIAAPISTAIHLSGTVTVTGSPVVHEQPEVSVLQLTTPPTTYTPITATVNGVRSATGDSAHPGTHSPLENAFDLQLVKT